MSNARHTLRNAGLLMGQRGLHVAGAALFAVLVPRLMGPEAFGRYALLTSVSLWFALLSGLGAVSLMTRTLPQFMAANDARGPAKLATNLLVLRAGTGLLAGAAYYLVVALLFGDLDAVAAAFVAAAVCCRSVANLCFALFLGLNQAARWGMGDLLRRWLTLLGVLVGFRADGLRGACLGFLLANVVVLAVGLTLARGYLRWSELDLTRRYLLPFLRVSTSFAAGSLLLSLVQRTGETMVRLSTGDFVQVGYYGAAFGIYITIGHALWQLAIALAPFLISEVHAGRPEVVVRWLERLLTWMVVVACTTLLAVVFVGGRLVPLVLGQAYEPVTATLIPLIVSLFTVSVASLGRLRALTLDRPGAIAAAAGLELAVFWGMGPLLASRMGSVGGAIAVLAASAVNAGFITWRLRRDLASSPVPAARAALLALVFLPLAWIGEDGTAVALLLASLAGYAVLLVWTGVVSRGDLATLRATIVRAPVTVTPAGEG